MNARKKRNLSIICAVVLCSSIVIGGTLAWFYDTDSITNVFTTAGSDSPDEGVEIVVEEPGYDPDTSKEMYPGDTIIKDPTVINNRGEVYMRFIVTLKDKDTGAVITDSARAAKIMSMLFFDKDYTTGGTPAVLPGNSYSSTELSSKLGANFQTPVNSDFTLDSARSSAGVMYYNYTPNSGKLANQETAVLFTHAILPSDWNQDDVALLGNFDIVIEAQGIQTKNIATASDAYTFMDAE